MIDSTDPVGPGAVLFTREFYAGCRRCLKPGRPARHPERAPVLAGGRARAERRLFPRAVRRRLRLSRQHPDLFRRADVLWLGHRQREAQEASAQEDRAPPREGRHLPHALLDPGGPCRCLRASRLTSASWWKPDRIRHWRSSYPFPRGEGGLRLSGASRVGSFQRQWNGLPEPVPGLDPGIKPGNDEGPAPIRLLSSPGSTGRSSSHRPQATRVGVTGCPLTRA